MPRLTEKKSINAKNYEFLIFAPNDWFGQRMNRQQIFSIIGEQFKTVYSNGPWQFHQIHSKNFKQSKFLGYSLSDGKVVIDYCPKYILYSDKYKKILTRIGSFLYRRYLNKYFSVNNNKILYLFHPFYAELADQIKNSLAIYHCYDDLSKQEYYTDKIREKERQLTINADIVFASSKAIVNRLKDLSGRKDIIFLPNGVDYERFSNCNVSEPHDMKSIPHPRVSYAGRMNTKFDFELINCLSNSRPNISFVLIGPVNHLSNSDTSIYEELKTKTNIYFLGNKPHNELANYMHYMDINTMAYKISESLWTSSIYPLKLHEYLAVAKPIISADFDAVKEFTHLIDIAKTPEDWLKLIDDNLRKPKTKAEQLNMRHTAKDNTWSKRANKIMDIIGAHHE